MCAILLLILAIIPALGRWYWLPDLFAHFVVHYAVAAAFLAIASLWTRHFLSAAVAGAILTWQVAQLAHYYLPQSIALPGAGTGTVIRLLQFNSRQQVPNQHEFMQWLAQKAGSVDVIALFEIDPSWESELRTLQRDYPAGGWRYTADLNGIALLSRLPMLAYRAEVLGPDILPTLRLVLMTADDGAIAVYATHPRAPVSHAKWLSRNLQYAAVAEAIRREPAPHMILLADLNTTVWSWWFKLLANATGLMDAQAGLGYRETWTGFGAPAWLGIPIDHTLISPSMAVREREFGPRLGSDHRVIVTTLALPGAGLEHSRTAVSLAANGASMRREPRARHGVVATSGAEP